MPLSRKGKKILKAMRAFYGKKRGTSIFYATENKGEVRGLTKKRKKDKS
jgi:hypothetical protein